MESCRRSPDQFTDEEGEHFLLELSRQLSCSTVVDNIIAGFNPRPATTTKAFYHPHHHLVSFDQNNAFNYKGRRGRINQTKAINPKQQMKQRQQRHEASVVWGEKMNRPGPKKEVTGRTEIGAGANWRYPHRHMQGTYGTRRESAGTGVFLPRHQPEDTSKRTDGDTKAVGRGQSNTTTTTTTTYAILSHHHHQPEKFQNLNDEEEEQSRLTHRHYHNDSVIRLPEEWTY